MASKALKGLTIKIGGDTSELTKALDGVEKQSRDLSSELGQINKLLKLDPKNTELLAQKQKVLADAIGSTEKKLDTLREAEKQVQAQFERGEVSEAQYRALQREIIATEGKLGKYKSAARETADALEELGDESGKAARKIDDQADSAEEASDASQEMGDAVNDLAKNGLVALTAAATAAVASIVALAEESREYRTEMAKLDTAFTDAGHTQEAATKTYEALQSVLGETDQAVEAANHLAKLCTTEEELAKWTEIATGIYGTFGASLPIEGLAEAANETMRVGQVTGPFADALNWAAKEGETFGVALKENVRFTEMSEEALATLTDAQRAEYKARGEQHKKIAEYNKKVEEAASAEDYFNIALQECTSEQERQKLITETLTKLYGSAAAQYKETNKEVIRANKATEKWNKATAKIGETVEPVLTDIKELGVTILEDANEPLEDAARFIRKEVLPALKDAGKWVKSNGPTIKGTLVGIATAMVAFKVATVATTVAQKGLKGAIVATTVAQKALALAQAATPWGLAAVAITAVTGALAVYAATTRDAEKKVDALTKEERRIIEAASDAADAFRDQQEATQDAMAATAVEIGTVQDMADELRELADESGKVQEKDQARVDFILGELNEALGTEYTMVDGIIQKYDELKSSIDELIQSKLANALLEDGQADYLAAQKAKADARTAVVNAEKDYQAQLPITQAAEDEYLKWKNIYTEALAKGDYKTAQTAQTMLAAKDVEWQKEKDLLAKKKTAYDDAQTDFENYANTIIEYETAQRFAAEGNYEAVKDILLKKVQAVGDYGDEVDEETAELLATLEMEALIAGQKAEKFREEFEKGSEGFTEEMVTEAEEGYQEALGKFASAYSDAYGVGEDFGQGIADGITIKNGAVGAAAIAQIRAAVKAAKKEAEINSPSKKTMAIGEGMGEGAEVGIERTTPDVKKAATNQAAAILDAYNAQELAGQRALRNVAELQASRQVGNQMTAAASNGPMLEKILAAIEKGQVLLLDGDTLVGATAAKMDNALGSRRVLASRGAI